MKAMLYTITRRLGFAVILWLSAAATSQAQTVHLDLQAYFNARMASYRTVTSFTFGVAADVHLHSGGTTKAQWMSIVAGWRDAGHLMGIVAGDIGFGAPEDITGIVSGVSEVPNAPAVFYALGNHELDPAAGKRAWIDGLYPGAVQPSSWTPTSSLPGNSDLAYWSFDIGNTHFVYLDANSVLTDGSRTRAGVLGTEQLSWLAGDLAANRDKPVVVIVHEPIEQPRYDTPYYTLIDRGVLIDTLVTHPKQVVLFSGHLHGYRGITKWKGLTSVHCTDGDLGPTFGVSVAVSGDAITVSWAGMTAASVTDYDQYPMNLAATSGGTSTLTVGEEGGDYGRSREKMMTSVSAQNGAVPTSGVLMLSAGPITWYDPYFVSEQLIKIVPGMKLSYDIQVQGVSQGLDAVALQPNWVMLDGSRPPVVRDQQGIALSTHTRDGSYFLYNEDLPSLGGLATNTWYHREIDLTPLAGHYMDGFYLASAAMAVNVQHVYVDRIRVTWSATGCSVVVAPTSVSIPAVASTGVITVTAPAGCAWTANSTGTWLAITSGAGGLGSGFVSFQAAANPNLTPRTATLTVGGVDVVVSQAGDVDTIAPDTTITGFPSASSSNATFTFTSSEPGSTFRCALDGGTPVACVSPVTFASLANGSHSFSVAATDLAGNPDLTPATYAWLVDTSQPPPTSVRRILVISPHPDDESLIAAGVIRSAALRGESVTVAVVTNGDVSGPQTGLAREGESVAAMGVLGLTEPDVIFLGYSDASLIDLYQSTSPTTVITSYSGQRATYGNRGLGGMDYHRYLTGASAPYTRGSILGDFKALLANVRPDDVYTLSYVDRHNDHQAVSLFLLEAIKSLRREGIDVAPRVHEAIVWAPCDCTWPSPVFAPTDPYGEPSWLATTPLSWNRVERVPVPTSMQDPVASTNLKHRTIEQYLSQGTDDYSNWLYSFVRKDEVFWVTDTRSNIAWDATVTASEDTPLYGQVSGNVADGIVNGPLGEWVAYGGAGHWVRLTWNAPMSLSQVILYDRLGSDRVLAGTLTFSDGSSVSVGALNDSGVGLPVTFPARTATWVQFTINQSIGSNTGLAEFEVYGMPIARSTNTAPYFVDAPVASPSTVSAGGTSALSALAYDVDGDALTYTWAADAGTIVGNGPQAVFTAPAVNSQPVFTITVTVTDGRGGSVANARFITSGGAPVAVSLSSLAISPASVEGGSTAQGTVTLSGPAAAAVVVTLTSSNSSIAMAPASVTIPAGAASASFSVQTVAVSTSTSVTLTAAYGGNTRSATLTVTAVAVRLASVALAPASVVAGATSAGTVTLTAPAGPSGVSVTLASSNTAVAKVPVSVVVAAGSRTATFSVTTVATAGNTTVTITARLSGQSTTARLTVSKAASAVSALSLSPTIASGGASSTGTVTLNGVAPAGGFVVTLASSNTVAAKVPATVTVPAGATSATFVITTSRVTKSVSVTISATGGGVKKSATLSVRP